MFRFLLLFKDIEIIKGPLYAFKSTFQTYFLQIKKGELIRNSESQRLVYLGLFLPISKNSSLVSSSVLVLMCLTMKLVCMSACTVARVCVCVKETVWTRADEEALCLLIMTSWSWQKLEKMPEVSEWNSSACYKSTHVCMCVCPWAIRVLLDFVNESQTVKDKKTKPDHQRYEAEGRPFGCSVLTGASARKHWGVMFKGRQRWEKNRERENVGEEGGIGKLPKGLRGQFTLKALLMFAVLRKWGLCCIMVVLGVSSLSSLQHKKTQLKLMHLAFMWRGGPQNDFNSFMESFKFKGCVFSHIIFSNWYLLIWLRPATRFMIFNIQKYEDLLSHSRKAIPIIFPN